MFITKLSVENFKGRTITHDFSPVTLITAGNFRHKTAIPLAIRLGMAGYLPPPLGVRSVYKLAGNPTAQGQMSIKLTFDTGREQTWKWTKNAEGGISVQGGLSPDIAMPELMLDPKLFWAKTATERIQTIFNVCEVGPEAFNPGVIIARLGEVQVSPVAYCEATLIDVQKRIAADPMKGIQDWIERILNWLKSEERSAKDAAKSASGAFKAFRIIPTGIAKNVSAELGNARQELLAIERTLLGSNVGGMAVQLEHVREKLQGYSTDQEYAAMLKGLQSVYNDRRPFEDDDDPKELLQDLGSIIGPARAKLDQLEHTIAALKSEAAVLTDATCCPKCQNKKPGWKKKTEDSILASLSAAMEAQKTAQETVAKATTKADAIHAWLSAEEKVPQVLQRRKELAELQAKEKTLHEKIEAIAKPDPELVAKAAALRDQIVTLEQQQRDWDVYQSDRERKEALEAQVLSETCRAEVLKAVAGIVIQEQNKLIDSSFKKVLNVAQHFTTGLINSPLEFVDGELGRRVTQADIDMDCEAPIGSWIPFETFSGTEELLALAGFSVALTGDAPVKLVILDEMGRLEPSRRVDVALRMLSLTESGIIDQAILIDVESKVYGGLLARKAFKIITP